MIKKKSMLFMNIRLKIVTNMSIEIDTCLSFIISKWLYFYFTALCLKYLNANLATQFLYYKEY